MDCVSMEVADARVLIGFELSAAPSQKILDRAEVFLANTLILVEFSSTLH